MGRPWIGMPTGYDAEKQRLGLDRYYTDAIEWAGGIPVLIPVSSEGEIIRDYADRLDGILLPGSATDIDPDRYGGERHAQLGRVFAERDRADALLLDVAEQRVIPVLGVCYGAQSINVFRGGSLIQDIPSDVPGAVSHDRPGEPEEVKSHGVRLDEGSRLHRLHGGPEAVVNSYHHQSVAEPGRDLRIAARAPDGVAEAVEDTRGRFVLGVQWHPETGWRTDPLARSLFSAFVEASRLAP